MGWCGWCVRLRLAMSDDLRARIQEVLPGLVRLRHEFHAHPELSYQEHQTSARVQRELSTIGVAFKPGLAGGTGVAAHLPATTGGATSAVGLRADMDALPIQERTGRAYASTNPGVMHACGHDGHTTILIGAARVLASLSHRPNPVTFVFQPAEEGGAGGERMCDDGCLLGDQGGGLGAPVGRMFGLHGWSLYDVGQVATKPGPLLAATDDFDVIIRGVQAHAAYPHQGRDPIVAAAAIVTALQTVASRTVDPTDACVVTVGRIEGGTANNIIPETVRLVGTVRTLRSETREAVGRRVRGLFESVAAAHGCRAEVSWHDGYPSTVNDPGATQTFFSVAREALGPSRVEVVEAASMGGEDFSYYGRHVPACFFLLGLRPAGATSYPTLHQPDFDFNDDALATGVEMMVRLGLAG